MAAPIGDFAGFGPDALRFLDGLEADNSKAYFDAHRSVYDEQVHRPLKQLVVAVGDQLASDVALDIEYEPKIGRSMFRINRDLRFSADKTPYHPHLDLAWWQGGQAKSSPGFIMRIRHDEVLTGVGVYGMDADRLSRYRNAVVGSPGDELEHVATETRRRVRGATMSEPSRKRVPKGFDPDHPRADWLRRDGFHFSAIDAVPASFTSARFATWVSGRLAKYADLHRWLVTHTN